MTFIIVELLSRLSTQIGLKNSTIQQSERNREHKKRVRMSYHATARLAHHSGGNTV